MGTNVIKHGTYQLHYLGLMVTGLPPLVPRNIKGPMVLFHKNKDQTKGPTGTIGKPCESGICLGRSDEVGAKHPPNRSPTSRVSHLSPSVNTLFCLILTVPTFVGEK